MVWDFQGEKKILSDNLMYLWTVLKEISSPFNSSQKFYSVIYDSKNVEICEYWLLEKPSAAPLLHVPL